MSPKELAAAMKAIALDRGIATGKVTPLDREASAKFIRASYAAARRSPVKRSADHGPSDPRIFEGSRPSTDRPAWRLSRRTSTIPTTPGEHSEDRRRGPICSDATIEPLASKPDDKAKAAAKAVRALASAGDERSALAASAALIIAAGRATGVIR